MLWLTGVGPFHALCYAMSTISTGGFVTSENGVALMTDASRGVLVVFMLGSALNFTLHWAAFHGRFSVYRHDPGDIRLRPPVWNFGSDRLSHRMVCHTDGFLGQRRPCPVFRGVGRLHARVHQCADRRRCNGWRVADVAFGPFADPDDDRRRSGLDSRRFQADALCPADPARRGGARAPFPIRTPSRTSPMAAIASNRACSVRPGIS